MVCRVCGGKAEKEIVTYDFMLNREKFVYVVCADCGTWQIKDIPDDIGKYYANDYYSYKDSDNIRSRAYFKRIAKMIIEDFKLIETSSVLDYGAGSINLLKGLYEEGVGEVRQLHKLRAFDKFAPEVEYNGIKLQNTLPSDMLFDLVISKHCIEHEVSPDDQVKNIINLLSDKGVCTMVAPNPDSWNAEYFQGNWIGIDGPRHLNIMPILALEMIIKRCGGEVVSKNTLGEAANFLTSEMYAKGKNWKDRDKYITDCEPERMDYLIGYSIISCEMGKGDMYAVNFKKSKEATNDLQQEQKGFCHRNRVG